ncbi:integral membrane sensor signal transduction histidine kinase [Calothrix parasitica NIES-267]|uniref:histidine kinase n=1 Tax=Calothrix parasitica NIES-267 TaxID=1973488 RepID=A0A1Z4LJ62_9CYAN|nr:integral membrane sensor signal transduction histidine kinase [Calothrix parasitica NIES-267]
MTEQVYTSEKLAQMHQSLWECVLQFAQFSAMQERHRIARDLHDSLGHSLTGLNFQLQTAIQLCQPESYQAQEFLNEAHRLVKVASQEVRQSVKALRNDELETQSLETLIESLINNFEQNTGILPEVEINLSTAIPSQFVTPIYRIIQESLNNVCKYAVATAVNISISYIYENSEKLYLKIEDNGRGFDPEKVCGGYGLQGIQERINFLQGNFQLESQPGRGCCITVEIPIHISNNPIDFDNFQSIKRKENKDNFSKLDIISVDNETQKVEESIVYPININSEHQTYNSNSNSNSIKIGEWQPLNLNYLL